jgi:Fe-S oxidoreductase
MPLPTGDLLGILKDNLEKRAAVLPLSKASVTRWANGLNIPRGGETVLYTGEMYQLVPYIGLMADFIDRVEDTPLARFVKVGRVVNKVFDISAFVRVLGRGRAAPYEQMLRNIALLLRKAGVDYGYLYEDELYCGALIYRYGLDHALELQARRILRMLKEHGVKSLITVDPHTTDLFKTIYPSLIGDFHIPTKNYLEVLTEHKMGLQRAMDVEVVIHDSCCYARYEGVINEPRVLLERAGFRIKEPKDSGMLTMCCGAPIEALNPRKALGVAEKRVAQLKEAGENIVTACPLCLASLSRAAKDGAKIDDLSNYLALAYF